MVRKNGRGRGDGRDSVRFRIPFVMASSVNAAPRLLHLWIYIRVGSGSPSPCAMQRNSQP